MKFSVFPFILFFSASAAFNATAESTNKVTNSLEAENAGVSYGLFKYKDTDALIKTVKLLQKFGFNTDVVAETLNLKVYSGGVIIFKPSINGKPLLSEDILAAFKNTMEPDEISNLNSFVIKNTPLTTNAGGTFFNQSYDLTYAGQRENATRPFQIPAGGIALTIVKLDNGRVLAISSSN